MAKKRAQAVAFLLVVILVLSLNAQAFAAEDARPGDVNYELSGDTLVISGSGTVQNGDIMQAVLEPSAIDKIVVCEGITGIGNWAFRSVFVNLSDIKLPKSLISIGIGAFEDCTALTRIGIPDGVTTIGRDAFAGCCSLRSVKLSKSLADIGIGAFCNCSSLTRIKIPDSVSSIGRNAFAQCDSLKDIYFGGSEAHWTALNVEIPPAATVHCNVNLQEKAPATSTLNGQVSPSADQATEGWSTKGTQLMDVVYNSDGTIHSLLERSGDIWTYWEYVYSRSGTFLYRKTNIGTPNFRWSHRYMPGTDITYCIMEDTIESCVEFTLEYEVTEVTKGDGLGPRDLYFQSENDSWQKVGMFEYNTYRKASRHFILNYPMSMQAFATPRQHPDDSSFSVSQRMTDIWIADYDYVQVAE